MIVRAGRSVSAQANRGLFARSLRLGVSVAGLAAGLALAPANAANLDLGAGAGTVTDFTTFAAGDYITNGLLNAAPNSNQSFDGVMTDVNGVLSVNKTGIFVLTLTNSGGNTYTGGTTVTAGALQGGASNVFSPNSILTNNAFVDLNGFAQTIAGLKGATGTVENTGGTSAILTIGGATTNSYSGTLIDNGSALSVVKTGAGIQSFNGASTYSGGTTIAGGVLRFGNATAFGTNTVTLNGGTLGPSTANIVLGNDVALAATSTFDTGGLVATLSGVVSGNGASQLIKIGNGSLTLSGVNTFQGGISLQGGTVLFTNNSSLGSGTISSDVTSSLGVASQTTNYTLNNDFSLTKQINIQLPDAGYSVTLTGAIIGTDPANSNVFLKSGNGVLIMPTTTTYKGKSLIASGYYGVTGNNSLGSHQNTIVNSGTGGIVTEATGITLQNAIVANALFRFDTNGFDMTQSGAISGNTAGLTAVEKTGSGRLTLSANSTYVGPTTVTGGELAITGSTLATQSVTVNSGTTLSGTGSTGNATILGGGILSPGIGANTPGTLTFNSLTLNAGSVMNFDLASAAGTSDKIIVNNNVILNGTLNINPLAGFGTGNYLLGTYGGTATDNGILLGSKPNGYIYSLTETGGNINLLITLADQYWNGTTMAANGSVHGGSGTWNAANTNWTDATGALTETWVGHNAFFTTTGGTVGVVGAQAFDKLTFTVAGYVLNGAGTLAPTALGEIAVNAGVTAEIDNQITGANGIIKSGAGIALLGGNNTFSGGLTINGGRVDMGSDTALGAGLVTITAGATVNAGIANRTVANNFLVTGGQLDNGGNILTVNGAIAGTSLVLQGSGTTALNSANTYNGGTALNGGTVKLGDAAALGTGTLTMATGTTLLAGTSLTVVNNIALGGAATIDNGGFAFATPGVISGSGPLTMIGTGTLFLANTNTYTGGTNVNVGSVVLSVAGSAGTGTIALAANTQLGTAGGTFTTPNAITIAGSASLLTQGAGDLWTLSGVIANGASAGTFVKNGPGTVILTNANTYTGGTNLNGGTLQVANGGNLGTGALTTSAGTTLIAGTAANQTFTIANAIALGGSTTLNLNGSNFSVNNAGAITTDGTALTLSGLINGSAALAINGYGDVLINNVANNYFGGTTVQNAGVLLGSAGALGGAGITLNGNAALLDNAAAYTISNAVTVNGAGNSIGGSQNLTVNGALGGSGNLTKVGSDVVTLAGGGTFNSNLFVNAGTVNVTSSLPAAGTTVAVAAGATLAGNGTIGGTVNVTGGKIAPGNAGAGTLTVGNLSLTNSTLSYELGAANVAVSPLNDRIVDTGNLTAAGTLTLNVTQSAGGNLTSGFYNLIQYSGTPTSTVTTETDNVPAGFTATTELNPFAKQVNLILSPNPAVVGSLLQYWDGSNQTSNGVVDGGTGIWDNNFNWTTADGSINATWQGDVGYFEGTPGTVTLTSVQNLNGLHFLVSGYTLTFTGAGALNTSTTSFFDTSPATTTTINAPIIGVGQIVKSGTGSLTLGGNNTYSGGTIVVGGSLGAGTDTAFGSNFVSLQSGTRLFDAVGNRTISNFIGLAGGGVHNIDSGGNVFTLSGQIGGVGTLNKIGAGTLVLANNTNSYTGGTIINAGIVSINNDHALGGAGDLTFLGGTLVTTGAVTSNRLVHMNGNGIIDTQANNDTFSGVFDGTGNFGKNGSGTLTLSGVNTNSGGVNLNAGAVRITNNSSLGTGALAMAPGTTLIAGIGASQVITLANAISLAGADNIDFVGGNSGFDTVTGATNTNGTTLTLNGTISGPGSLTSVNNGIFNINGNNSYSGGTNLTGVVASIGTGTALGTGLVTLNDFSGIINNSGNALTLANAISSVGTAAHETVLGGSSDLTLTGGLSGSGGIAKAGADRLTLAAATANSFSGILDVNKGELRVDGALTSAAGTVNLNIGSTLTGTGSIAGTVNAADFSTISPGDSPGTLTVGNLNLSQNTLLNYELGAPNVNGGALNDKIIVTGNLVLDGKLSVINPVGGNFGLGIYNLITYGGTLTDNTLDLAALPPGYNGIIQTVVPGQVNLVITNPGTLMLYWDAADSTGNGVISGGTGTWNAANANWTGAAPSALDTNWQPGSLAVFAGAAGTVTINGTQSVQGLQFTTTGYTLNGPGSISTLANSFISVGAGLSDTINATITGVGPIAKQGTGNLVLGGTNTYTGGTDLQGGTITVTGNGALSSGQLTMSGVGTTLTAGASGLTIANAIALNNTGNTIDTQANTFTLTGVVSGSQALNKIGTGTLVLGAGAVNTFAGGTNLSVGTIQVNNNASLSSGALAMAGGTKLQAGSANLLLANNVGLTGSDTVDTQGFFLGLVGTVSGSGSLTKIGSGTLGLLGANSYTGGTSLNVGQITVGTNTSLGTNTLAMAAGTTLQSGAAGLTLANNIGLTGNDTVDTQAFNLTLGGTISGGGNLTKIGSGNLTLGGSNGYTGGTNLNVGSITVNTGTALGTGLLAMNGANTSLIAGAPFLVINNGVSLNSIGNAIDTQANVFTLAGAGVSGTGALNKVGSGLLILATANTYTGGTNLDAGSIQLNNAAGLGTGTLTMADGTILQAGISGMIVGNTVTTLGSGRIDSGSGVFTLNGNISGAGSISQIGTGNLVLNGNNSFTNLGINQGTVTLGTNTAAGIGAITINNGAILAAGVSGLVVGNGIGTTGSGRIDSGNGIFTLNGNISGPGSISQIGTGNLVLNGNNSFTNLGINQGTVTLGTNTAAGIGAITINNGAILAAGVSGLVVGNGIGTTGSGRIDSGTGIFTLNGNISGPGSISQIGTGNLVLNGNNSFAAGLGINQGTVTVGTNTAAGTGAIAINNGAVLAAGTSGLTLANTIQTTGSGRVNSGSGVFTLNGAISGAGSISQIGTGNLVLNGNNSFTNLGINQGTVTLGTNTAAGIGAITINNGAILAAGVSGLVVGNGIGTTGSGRIDSGNGIFTLNGNISGPGSISQIGTGNLVLNGNNSFAAGLGINQGTVTVGTNTAAGTGAIAINNGAILAAGVSGLTLVNTIQTTGSGRVNSGSGVFTLNGAISGAGSISQIGTGNLVLNGNNSFTNLGINQGTVTLGTNTAAGIGAITINNGAILAAGVSGLVVGNGIGTTGSGRIDSGNGIFTLNGNISGPGSISQIGTGNLVLNGNNSFTNLGINQGTVTVGSDTAAGIGGITINNGAILASAPTFITLANGIQTTGSGRINSGPLTFTLNGNIGGAGSISQIGTGNLVLNGNNSFTNLGINQGTVTVGTNTAAGIGSISLNDGATLAAGISGLTLANAIGTTGAGTINSGTGTFGLSGQISGAGGFTKTGTGTLNLTGASIYTGATNVNVGTLKVNGSLGNTAVTVASGATLGGSGSIAGSVSVLNGGNFNPGNSPGTITVGSLTLNNLSNVNYDLGAPNTVGGVFNDLTIVTGPLVLDGLLNVTNSGAFGLGIYELFQYGGALTDNGLVVNSLPGSASGLIQTGITGQVNLVVTAPGTLMLYWDGADGVGNGVISGGSGTWNNSNGNWTGGPPSAINASWAPNSIAVFQTTGGTVNVAATEQFTGLQFAVNGYTLANGGGSLLTNPAGSFLFASTGVSSTINAPITGLGSIAKQGGGTITLNGASTYSGGTDIQGGTLAVGNNAALGTGSVTIENGTILAAATSGVVLANAIVTPGSARIDSGSGVFTLNGNISGAGSISQIGTGNLVLNGNNSFAAGLGINQGTVTVGTSTAAGTGGITINNGAILAAGVSGLTLANGITTTGGGRVDSGSGVFTLNGAISGAGSISQIGTGNLVLNGNNSFTNLGINQGTVTLGTNTAAGIGGITINNGAILAAGVSGLVVTNAITTTGGGRVDSGSGIFTLNGNISGAGSISQIGTGNLVLNGNNSFAAGLGINQGTVTVGTNTAAGTGAIAINNGAILAAGVSGLTLVNTIQTTGSGRVNSGSGVFTLSGTISGAGSISQIGTGNLVLNGNNSFAAGLGINQGTVTVGTNTAAGTGGIAINNGAILAAGVSGLTLANAITTTGSGRVDSGSGVFTLSGNIDGAGSISQIGTGNLVLNGNNSFAAGLGINQGTVTVGTNTAAGTGGITINNGAILAAGVSGLTLANAITTTGGGRVDSGSGVFTLSGNIDGAGSISQIGTGNLVLNGNNSFTNLGINQGTVTLGTNTAAGIGGITINNGAILAAGVSGLVVTNAITTTGGGRVDSGSGVFTLNGVISGAGSISQIGTGNLVLNGNNSYTNLGINQGTVTLGTNTAAGIGGITINNGAILAAGVSGLVVTNAITTTGGGRVDSGSGIFTLNGVIGGAGSISQIGTGNLVLNGNNSFAAGLGINQGTVTVGTNTAAGTGAIAINNGAILAAGVSGLTLANTIQTTGSGRVNSGSGVFTLNGVISGVGSISQIGTGNLILNGVNTFSGGLGINQGTVTVTNNSAAGSSFIALNGPGTLVAGVSGLNLSNQIQTTGAGTVNSGSGAFTLSGSIIGVGGLVKTGSGTLNLIGTSSYTGATNVTAGTLNVTGSIGSSATTLASGTLLTGTGTVGTLTVGSGSTVSPAGSGVTGTLTVNGGISFGSTATYAADVTTATADRIVASGPASLAGTLALNVGSGTYLFNQSFTVLTSSARTGTFTTTGLGNFGVAFNPTVTYTATSVIVTLTPQSLLTLGGSGLTTNEAQVAGAFDRATAAGFNPQGFYSLYTGGAAIPGYLIQLTGELHSAERRAALEDTRVVREAAFDRLNADASTVSNTQTASARHGDAETTVWLRGAGSWGNASATTNSAHFTTQQLGVITGIDYKTGDWKVGAAFSYIHNDVDLASLGQSKVKSTGGLIYGGYRQDNGFAIGAGGSIAGVKMSGNRAISVPGLGQTLIGSDDGTIYQLFGEAAYDLTSSSTTRVEPFARFAYTHLKANAFSEGGGIAAVSGIQQSYHLDVATVGLRGSTNVGGAILSGSIGYQNTSGDRSPTALLTIAGLGQTQAINAVALDKDAVAIEAQAAFRIGKSATLGIGYSGVFGDKNRDNGARATLTVGF